MGLGFPLLSWPPFGASVSSTGIKGTYFESERQGKVSPDKSFCHPKSFGYLLVWPIITSREVEKTNSCVRCLAVDFSKAFDSVDHAILLSKLAHLNIPPALVNWICSFLTRRTQCAKLMASYPCLDLLIKALCKVLPLDQPHTLLWRVTLPPLSGSNQLFKCADDTT